MKLSFYILAWVRWDIIYQITRIQCLTKVYSEMAIENEYLKEKMTAIELDYGFVWPYIAAKYIYWSTNVKMTWRKKIRYVMKYRWVTNLNKGDCHFSFQILHVVKFIRKFIDDNPLCVCSEEIGSLKKLLSDQDEIKLKQKSSQVVLKLREGQYFMNVRLTVPDNYPFAATG